MEKMPADFKTQIINSAHHTHEGMVGKNNEDSLDYAVFKTSSDNFLYLGVVADGVGGQMAGEFASRFTIESIMGYFSALEDVSSQEIPRHIHSAILNANQVVYERAQSDTDLEGMATTIVVAAIYDGLLFTAHVGDSRIYILRDGDFNQLTKDHSWVQEAIDAGLLTPEQAREHPNKNIIRRSIGTSPEVRIDLVMQNGRDPQFSQAYPLQSKDIILLCSDGLTDMILDASAQESLDTHVANLGAATRELIDKANAAGGRDNISVVLMQTTDEFVPNANPPQVALPVFDDEESEDSDKEDDSPDESNDGDDDSPAIATQVTEDGVVEIYQEEPMTVRGIPRVVSTPLDIGKQERQRKRLMTMLIIFAVLLFILAGAIIYIYATQGSSAPQPEQGQSLFDIIASVSYFVS